MYFLNNNKKEMNHLIISFFDKMGRYIINYYYKTIPITKVLGESHNDSCPKSSKA